jgi:hypothetical protein
MWRLLEWKDGSNGTYGGWVVVGYYANTADYRPDCQRLNTAQVTWALQEWLGGEWCHPVEP